MLYIRLQGSSLGFCASLQELTVKGLGPRFYLDNVTEGIRYLRSMKMKQFTFSVDTGSKFTGESERLWKSLDEVLHCDRFAKVECVLIKFHHSSEAEVRDCFHLAASRGVLQTRDMTYRPRSWLRSVLCYNTAWAYVVFVYDATTLPYMHQNGRLILDT